MVNAPKVNPVNDDDELFKGIIHATAMVLAGAMGLHNLKEALSSRGTPRHWANAIIYLFAAVPWECVNTHDHWTNKGDS